VEAVFNTLLEDEELLRLLFSLLDQEPPLSCKAAGYFGRVVGQLLLRKTNEMMQHLSHNDEILEKLIKHVDTTSIADIIKRLVGADDHSSMIFSPMHTQWLADTPLVGMLLGRLGPQYSSHVQVTTGGRQGDYWRHLLRPNGCCAPAVCWVYGCARVCLHLLLKASATSKHALHMLHLYCLTSVLTC
jgi:hypothetical protein